MKYIKGNLVIHAILGEHGMSLLEKMGFKTDYKILEEENKAKRRERLEKFLQQKRDREKQMHFDIFGSFKEELKNGK